MEKDIIKILKRDAPASHHSLEDDTCGCLECKKEYAKEIVSHITEFIKWKDKSECSPLHPFQYRERLDASGLCKYWNCYDGTLHSLEQVYQFWKDNINK